MYRVLRALKIAPKPRNRGQFLMKTAIKRENYKFLVMPLKHVSAHTGHVNRAKIPKLKPIAKENNHKTRNRQVFGHASQTCIGSYGTCKSPRNLKIVGNNS